MLEQRGERCSQLAEGGRAHPAQLRSRLLLLQGQRSLLTCFPSGSKLAGLGLAVGIGLVLVWFCFRHPLPRDGRTVQVTSVGIAEDRGASWRHLSGSKPAGSRGKRAVSESESRGGRGLEQRGLCRKGPRHLRCCSLPGSQPPASQLRCPSAVSKLLGCCWP